MKHLVPWFVKIPAKIVLSRLPVGYRTWRRLNLFSAGAMDTPEYALDVFTKHRNAAGFESLEGRTVLELGPGDSILTALYARSFGATRTWLVDSDGKASQDTGLLSEAARMLVKQGRSVPDLGCTYNLNAALEVLNAHYLTQGLSSLKTIPGGEIDLIFSQAVLEHVRLAEFPAVVREMRRILKPTGVASHRIDFRDHLQSGLNNLRFSERVWESEFMARSGFYTNRLTWPAMECIFREAGLAVVSCSLDLWPNALPTSQRSMAAPFRDMAASQLMVMGASVVLRPMVDRQGDQS